MIGDTAPLRSRWLPLLVLCVACPLRAQTDGNSDAVHKLLSDSSSIGLPVATKAPAFELKDQNGRARSLPSLAGPKGTILVFFRSADW